MSTILVTGGAGFIGSNYIRHHPESHPDDRIINLDLVTYAGNLENLAGIEDDSRYRFLKADVADRESVEKQVDETIDQVVHFAAESHVDRSIEDAGAFLRTNVTGTQVMVDLSRKWGVEKFLHVSTDEVYGSLGSEGFFTEDTSVAPNSPYSASKAASDFLVRAAVQTHGFPGVITRCSNNYGPFQFPEKLIPLMVSNALEDRELPVYGDGLNVRDWLYVLDHCRAIDLALENGRVGEVYNIGGNNECTNLKVIQTILAHLGKPETLMVFVEDRKGHDRRYAIDATKSREELGFTPSVNFEDGLKQTIDWYVENRPWWDRIKSGEYQDYYSRMYGDR